MAIECGPDGCRGFGNAVGAGSFATSLLVLAGLLFIAYVVAFLTMELVAASSRLRSPATPPDVGTGVPHVLSPGLRWAADQTGSYAWAAPAGRPDGAEEARA